jgi:hypothetical protein
VADRVARSRLSGMISVVCELEPPMARWRASGRAAKAQSGQSPCQRSRARAGKQANGSYFVVLAVVVVVVVVVEATRERAFPSVEPVFCHPLVSRQADRPPSRRLSLNAIRVCAARRPKLLMIMDDKTRARPHAAAAAGLRKEADGLAWTRKQAHTPVAHDNHRTICLDARNVGPRRRLTFFPTACRRRLVGLVSLAIILTVLRNHHALDTRPTTRHTPSGHLHAIAPCVCECVSVRAREKPLNQAHNAPPSVAVWLYNMMINLTNRLLLTPPCKRSCLSRLFSSARGWGLVRDWLAPV